MSDGIKDLGAGIGVLLLIGFLAWVIVQSTNYNAWATSTCEDAGLRMVQEWPFGHYGCADVIPFDEVGERD